MGQFYGEDEQEDKIERGNALSKANETISSFLPARTALTGINKGSWLKLQYETMV